MGNRKGKKFNDREVAPVEDDGTVAQANQWRATEKQLKWLKYYLDPKEKETYGNAYQSGIKAGYSPSYSEVITRPSVGLQWVESARTIMRTLKPDHLRNVLEEIALGEYEKTSDRIAAIKLLGVEQGMFTEKKLVAVGSLEQAIQELE